MYDVQAIYLFFLLVAAPVLFFIVVWATVTASRLYFPKRPLTIDSDMLRARWERQATDKPVGVREIHEAHRRREHQRQLEAPLHYVPHEPASRVPDEWVDDLWERRN